MKHREPTMPIPTKGTIVCIHGLGRTPLSMWLIMLQAKRHGYHVLSWGYPSRKAPGESHAELLASYLEKKKLPDGPVHFITFSLGGYVLSLFLKNRPQVEIGRVVMIAPPLGGSELIDEGIKWPLFADLLGPIVSELKTKPVYANHPELHPEIGIIAGSRGPWPLSLFFSEPNDGKVSVRSTQNIHAKEHLVVPYSHPELIYRTDVIEHALRFIETGTMHE